MSPDINKQFHAVLAQKGIDTSDREAVGDLVYHWTCHRTRSRKEMTDEEAKHMIQIMNKGSRHKQYTDEQENRMRRKLIAMAREIGWEIEKDGKTKADMNRINRWVQTVGKYKKPLNDHSKYELGQLLSQFEQVYLYYLRKNNE